MNVPGLGRENVASHLQVGWNRNLACFLLSLNSYSLVVIFYQMMQKYRLYLRRIGQQPQNGAGSSFLEPQDAGFGAINGLDPQALASSAHINKSVPIVDQRNVFSFSNPNMRFVDGQQHHNHGMIPTNMDAQQLVALHQSAQPFGKMHMNVHSPVIRQLVQPQMLNQVGGNQLLTHRSSVGPPVLSQAVPGYRMDNNVRPPTYTPLPQNVGSSQHQGRADVLFQPGFASEQHRNGHMRNGPSPRPSHAGSSQRIKTERLPDKGIAPDQVSVAFHKSKCDYILCDNLHTKDGFLHAAATP